MGFPVDVLTDSENVISAASRVWSSYRLIFAVPAVAVRVRVRRGHSSGVFHPPVCEFEEERLRIAGPLRSRAMCDLTTGAGFAQMTQEMAADHAWLAYYFLEPLAYIGLEVLYMTALHSSCVALDGRAVLLCGDSGAGKTSLAYACARRGWTFISGDATHIVRNSPEFLVAGRPHQIRFRECARQLFPELHLQTVSVRPNGRRDIEISPQDLGLASAGTARAAHIVFLNRIDACSGTRIDRYPKEEAARRWRETSCWGNHRLRLKRWQSIERFLELPVHRLTYTEVEDAETALRSLMADRD